MSMRGGGGDKRRYEGVDGGIRECVINFQMFAA